MRVLFKSCMIYVLILIFCLTQVTQGWCVQADRSLARETIATHIDNQKVTEAYRPGKSSGFSFKKIQDIIIEPVRATTVSTAKQARSRLHFLWLYLKDCKRVYHYYRYRLASKKERFGFFKGALIDIVLLILLFKPVIFFVAMAVSKGPVSTPIHLSDSVDLDTWRKETLVMPRDGISQSNNFKLDGWLIKQIGQIDFSSVPDSLRCHFFNYGIGKDSVSVVTKSDSLFFISRIVVTNPYDYDVLDSIARGDIPASYYWQSVAEESIRWYNQHGGREALARKEMDTILASLPRHKVRYRVTTKNGNIYRTYLKPDMEYLASLVDSLSPLPNVTVPIMSERASIKQMQAIIKNGADNDLPIAERDLIPPMAHLIANYLTRAASDLEVFILPMEYLTGMYPEAHSDFFTIEWLNAQRHRRVDSTTVVIEIHLETDLTATMLGFGNNAYPLLVPKKISDNGNGMAEYSHFLEYPNAELLESMPQSLLVKSSPDFLKLYIARKIEEVIIDLRSRQPHVKKIALTYGHTNGYLPPSTKIPSTGWISRYKTADITFHRDSVITRWEDIVKRDEVKGPHYYYNRISRTWLNERGIKAHDLQQLRQSGILTWSEDSYPYVHFSDTILRGGRYVLLDVMREMGWSENESRWKWIETALNKHGTYILTREKIERFGLAGSVKATGWPTELLEEQTNMSDPDLSSILEVHSAA